MVQIGKLPARRAEDTVTKTPYDMLTVKIGDATTQARPYEVVTDKDSNEQRPSKAVTSCPQCGHGIHFDIRLDLLVSGALSAACDNCGAGRVIPPAPLSDPFRNPLADGMITRVELDGSYADPGELMTQARETAADRIKDRQSVARPDDQPWLGDAATSDSVGDALGEEDD